MSTAVIEPPPPAVAKPEEGQRRLFVRGITWSAAYQLFEVALGFASMLLLVRIIPPADSGRAAAVTGILALLNTFGAHAFIEHALQLAESEEPDWQLHWSCAFYIQLLVTTVGQILAGLCWFSKDYRPIAKLLHIAALGLLMDWPNQFSATMLRRRLDLRRLRIVAAAGVMVRIAATVSLALSGLGAYAIVIGGNVVTALPFTLDLLFIRRWRPAPGWYRMPSWRRYTAATTFGLQRVGAQLIGGVRTAAESALLPVPLGFGALGLVNRAQALYATTFGRAGAVLADVVYPFLPRASHDRERYASHATMYLRVMFLLSVPAALFVADCGPILSRALYGTRWVAMDPLIRPGALVGLALSALGTSAAILMAAGRMRDCLIFEALGIAGAVPALALAWVTRQPAIYLWACAGSQTVVAVAALWRASPLLRRGWVRVGVAPPLIAALIALAAVRICIAVIPPLPSMAKLGILGGCYLAVNLTVMRIGFAPVIEGLLTHAPAGDRIKQLLRLRTETPASLAPLVMREDLP